MMENEVLGKKDAAGLFNGAVETSSCDSIEI
jgi:hypothetical protein